MKQCRINYTLLPIMTKENKKIFHGNDCQINEELLIAMQNQLYGTILQQCQLVPNKPWVFDVKSVLCRAMKNHGIYPETKVEGNKLIRDLEAKTYQELIKLVTELNIPDDKGRICLHTKKL